MLSFYCYTVNIAYEISNFLFFYRKQQFCFLFYEDKSMQGNVILNSIILYNFCSRNSLNYIFKLFNPSKTVKTS